MNTLSQEQTMLCEQAERLLRDFRPQAATRALLDGRGEFDHALWSQVVESGWPAIGVPAEHGGLGLGLVELCLVAERIGRHVASLPWLASAVLATTSLVRLADATQQAEWLPKLATGEWIGCVGFMSAPRSGPLSLPNLELRGDRLVGRLSAVLAGAQAHIAVVPARCPGQATGRMALVDLRQPGVVCAAMPSLDNGRGYAELNFNEAVAVPLGRSVDALAELQALLDVAVVAAAFEAIGGADAALAMACDYAKERHAFGQAIGTFQAVKHRLADAYALIEVARGNADAAVRRAVPDVLGCAASRLSAVKAYEFIARENIQVHGGMGVTWECDAHLHYRRARALALELGSAPYWRDRLVDSLLGNTAAQKDGSVDAATDDLHAYRCRVQAWLAEHAPRFGGAARQGLTLEQDLALGRQWQALKAAHGYAGINWGAPYGAGGTEAQKLVFGEEELRWRLPTEYFEVSLGMPIPIMLKYADERAKLELVPPALRGETIWCQLFSEPAAGSDLAALRLKAVPDGDHWVLSGQKIWTTMGQFSDWGVVVARSDSSLPKHKGLTYFYLDLKSPGVTVRPIRKLSGHATFCEVFFDSVRIPDAQRLGRVGEGFRVAMDTLMIERYAVLDDACWGTPLELLLQLGRDMPSGPAPGHKDAVLRAEVADVYAEERGLAAIHARALDAIASGREPGPEGAIRKLLSATKRQRMSALALDLMGPQGLALPPHAMACEDFAASWIDAPGFRVAGGTDEILRNTIAERILGLPQDHRPDKLLPFNQMSGP